MDRIWSLLNTGILGSEFTPFKLLTVMTLTGVLIWVTRRATRWLVANILTRRGVDVGMGEALGAILRYVIVSLGALVILQSAGIDLTSLTVFVGAIGVGLGFGLQNVTSNFFSGLILLFERPVKIGDRVEIGGSIGQVREIGARATTMVTDDSIAVIVPNSQFVSERVTNFSRPSKLTAYVLAFHVSHESDPELVRHVLLTAAASHPDVLGDPAPGVEFAEVGLAALRFHLQVWSKTHVASAGALKSDLNFEVWKQLAKVGITIRPPRGVTLGLELIGNSTKP